MLQDLVKQSPASSNDEIMKFSGIKVTSHEHHGISNRQQLNSLFNNIFMFITEKMTALHCWSVVKQIHRWLVVSLTKANHLESLSTYYITMVHDVIKWKHFPCYWPIVRGIHQSPVDSPHKGKWCKFLMFSLICAWTNIWANLLEMMYHPIWLNHQCRDVNWGHPYSYLGAIRPSLCPCILSYFKSVLWNMDQCLVVLVWYYHT